MLLTIKQLQVKYGSHTALQINSPLCIEEGERIGVIGSNGAGKSTLVKALLGLINYEGRIVTDLEPEQMAAHMQSNAYVTTMPVKRIMEMVLDTKTRQKLMEKMVEWYRDKKDSFIIVSHYYEELEQLADKILLLDQGKVIAFGRKEELFRTYCGSAIFIMDNNSVNISLVKGFHALKSPGHLIALSCRDKEEERRLLSILMDNNVNFKRSNSDIEIMSINAREQFYAKA